VVVAMMVVGEEHGLMVHHMVGFMAVGMEGHK
jgi:hypothetical protein